MQRIVLECLQSLHRKASQGVGMVTLSRPGTSWWKHMWGAEAQTSCLPMKAGCQGQEGSPSTALRAAAPGRCVWACSCRHQSDSSWPQASTQRPLPVAASTQTNPAFPQEIKGCTLFSALQASQPLRRWLCLPLGQSPWVRCLAAYGIFQSSLHLNEEKAGILNLTNGPPLNFSHHCS